MESQHRQGRRGNRPPTKKRPTTLGEESNETRQTTTNDMGKVIGMTIQARKEKQ